jgi:non-homologous end joining protein Ku
MTTYTDIDEVAGRIGNKSKFNFTVAHDTPYYLTPSDKVSEEAFAVVIRDALADKKMAGLARMVLYRRERPLSTRKKTNLIRRSLKTGMKVHFWR